MRAIFQISCLAAVCAGAAMGAPSISALQNNYSYILPGLPNYGIAQGSIFILYGSGLGPGQVTSAPAGAPLQQTLAGVSIDVTANGTTTHALPYYVSATQLAAILPSATPVGDGKITVTYNGAPSPAADIKVLPAAFGMLTLNQAGSGPAAAFDANNNYAYLGVTAAANPGDTIVLWGTGLGPAEGDETAYPFPQVDMTTPIQVLIGGQAATVTYHGRSQFPGLDQINVEVPQGVTGCYVSVLVKTGDLVSNSATIPIAASGRTCSDPASGLSASDIQDLFEKGTFSIGGITLGRSRVITPPITVGQITTPGSDVTTDYASASFVQFTPSQFNSYSGLSQTSVSGCTIYNYRGQSATPPQVVQPKFLDAGPSITMTLPGGGTRAMPQDKTANTITYAASGSNAQGSAQPPFFTAGHYTFDNGSGGVDVKQFQNAQIDAAEPLVWTELESITEVDRAAGLTVNWTGGSGTVLITGSSFLMNGTDPNSVVSSTFLCTAPASAKTFTVPSAVLSALPASGSISGGGISFALPGALSVGNYSEPVKFTAEGVDQAYIVSYTTNTKSVTYK